jgi:hypothetical protein
VAAGLKRQNVGRIVRHQPSVHPHQAKAHLVGHLKSGKEANIPSANGGGKAMPPLVLPYTLPAFRRRGALERKRNSQFAKCVPSKVHEAT